MCRGKQKPNTERSSKNSSVRNRRNGKAIQENPAKDRDTCADYMIQIAEFEKRLERSATTRVRQNLSEGHHFEPPVSEFIREEKEWDRRPTELIPVNDTIKSTDWVREALNVCARPRASCLPYPSTMPRAKLRESRRAGKDAFFQLIEYRLRRSLAIVKWDDTLHSLAALHNQAMATSTLMESEYDIGAYDEVVSFQFRDEVPPCDVMKKAFRSVPGYSSLVLNPIAKYGAIAILGNWRCFYATLFLSRKRPSVRQDAVVFEQSSGPMAHIIKENDEHLISKRLRTTAGSSRKSKAAENHSSVWKNKRFENTSFPSILYREKALV